VIFLIYTRRISGWDGMGWDGMGWDEVGWGGMGWDGMGWDGMVPSQSTTASFDIPPQSPFIIILSSYTALNKFWNL
jgi:hypothetical protein